MLNPDSESEFFFSFFAFIVYKTVNEKELKSQLFAATSIITMYSYIDTSNFYVVYKIKTRTYVTFPEMVTIKSNIEEFQSECIIRNGTQKLHLNVSIHAMKMYIFSWRNENVSIYAFNMQIQLK